jgi:hypothetical protein
VVLLGQVDRCLAEGSHDLDERLAEWRATGGIPGDAGQARLGLVEFFCRGKHVVGGHRRLQPGLLEQILAVG